MRSIKINSRKHSVSPNKQLHSNLQYSQFFNNTQSNASMKQKLGSIVAEACSLIENTTGIKLNLEENIKKWLVKDEVQDGKVLEHFKIFIIESIENLIKNNERWQKSINDEPTKIIRIKSEERMKLRLLKQNERLQGQFWEAEQLKQQLTKQKQIYELKNLNRKLERKILLLSAQFNEIKKNYEVKIQKYKKLLCSSLINLQNQLGDEIGQFENRYYGFQGVGMQSSSAKKFGQEMVFPTSMRSARSQQFRQYGLETAPDRIRTQQSYKYMNGTTSALEEGQKRLSHKYYGSR